jgi:hypothetical protein
MGAPDKTTPSEENGSATRSEKSAALDALEDDEYGKLLRSAEFTAMKFSGRVRDSDAEDLLR